MVVWCVNYVILQHYILHLYLIFLQIWKEFITFARQSNNNPKHINPINPNIMISKHLQGGYRLQLPPSMQCVARVAIPAILFAMIICFSSCAMQ